VSKIKEWQRKENRNECALGSTKTPNLQILWVVCEIREENRGEKRKRKDGIESDAATGKVTKVFDRRTWPL
jgi:hypothetical protein